MPLAVAMEKARGRDWQYFFCCLAAVFCLDFRSKACTTRNFKVLGQCMQSVPLIVPVYIATFHSLTGILQKFDFARIPESPTRPLCIYCMQYSK